MTAAIMSFQAIDHPHKMMILGSMMELGDYTKAEHFKVASLASAMANTKTIYVGDYFKEAAGKFGAQWYPDADMLSEDFRTNPPKDILCLIKGSRAMRLERLIAVLK
jgi:UDP-N-acetylmuramoyl-tripeptide--D-alanyl-D-alanine ligase